MKKRSLKWSALLIVALGLASWGSHTLAQGGSTALPDLVPTKLEVIPENAKAGDVPAVKATIANQGNADASAFWVTIRAGSQIVASQHFEALAVNQEVQVQALFAITTSSNSVEVDADSTQSVAESNENNNALVRQIDFSPDIVIQGITFTPNFPKPSERTTIQVTVVNPSTRSIDKPFSVRFMHGRTIIDDKFIQKLGAGQSQIVEGIWTASGGEQTIRVIADYFNSIPESNETNNLVTRLLDVTTIEPNGADLSIKELQMTPSSPTAGDVVTLQATVVNHGSGAASAFKVLFQADGFDISSSSVPSLGPNQSTQVTVLWTSEAAQRLLRVKADSDGVVPEEDETDNGTTLNVDLSPPVDRCGQFVWLNVQQEAIPDFVALTGLTEEEVKDVFLPQVKKVMEQQYAGINVQIRLTFPPAIRATITYNDQDKGEILGQAPLGTRFGTGFVYMGSFTAFHGLTSLALSTLRVITATVSSHELGHLFGLNHTSQNDSRDIMSANAELSPLAGLEIPQFTPGAHQHLLQLLPFCH
jgi:hypothetical protein